MLDSIIKLRQPIKNLITKDNTELSSYYLSTADLNILANIANILKIFEKPTIKLQASKYPTLYYSLPYYLNLKKDLDTYKTKDFIIRDSILYRAISSSITKLEKYLNIDKEKEELLFSIILDPRRKLSAFKHLNYEDNIIENIKTSFIRAYTRLVLIFLLLIIILNTNIFLELPNLSKLLEVYQL